MAETTDVLSQAEEDKKLINKLYDDSLNKQKETISGNYTQNTDTLGTQQQGTQQQTQQYQERTDVESEKGANSNAWNGLSSGAQSQVALTLDNQKQKDTTTLAGAQAQADAEYERQRQLLANQYEAAIKQAQADNDMERAQQLYDAAKAAEEQLRSYQQSAGDALAAKGDYSIVQNLYGLPDAQSQALQGLYTPSTAEEGYTIPESLQAEAEALQRIYNASLESQNQQLQSQYEQSKSDLEAQRQQQQRATDESLTQAYVDALKQGKNYNEYQTAYGLGSGTKAQASLAREAGLQDDLTSLRKLQTSYDAQSGLDASALLKSYLASREQAQTEANSGYNQAIQSEFQQDMSQRLADQEAAGQILAKDKNDYSVLGKLWGLTDDQINRLQGTGAYAPQTKSYYGGSPTQPSTEPNTSTNTTENITWADVVDGAIKTAISGGDTNAYIQAAKSEGLITAAQVKDLKTNLATLTEISKTDKNFTNPT